VGSTGITAAAPESGRSAMLTLRKPRDFSTPLKARNPNMLNRNASRHLGTQGVALCCALAIGAGSLALAGTAFAKDKPPAAAAKITEEEAKAIALKAVPGEVTKVVIERKKGTNAYVVEIMSEEKGEIDVFVDMSGKVIGMEK
jgi:hypothetical protein